MELRIEKILEHYYVKIGCQEFIFDTIEQMEKTACELINEWIKTGKLFEVLTHDQEMQKIKKEIFND